MTTDVLAEMTLLYHVVGPGKLLFLYPALLLQSHLLGHPEADGAADDAKPDHQIVLPGAGEVRHGLAQETRVDKKRGDARDRMMLVMDRKKWFVSLRSAPERIAS